MNCYGNFTKTSIVVIHNVVSPYKTLLFNQLNKLIENWCIFTVFFLAKTERRLDWDVNLEEIRFNYEILSNKKLDDTSNFLLVYRTFMQLSFHNPDLVIIVGYFEMSCWAAFCWAKINKKKVIIIVESHYLDKKRYFIKEIFKRFIVSRCDAALVDGQRHKDYTVKLGMKEDRVFIKNGTGPVDVDYYQSNMKKYNKNDLTRLNNIPEHNLIFVGRFSIEKNIFALLRAYSRLSNEKKKLWGLILMGNGPQKEEIKQFITANTLKNVFTPGFVQKADIIKYYAMSDILVLPSISEPWGLVVSEALACGLPVIVSNQCGSFPDIVKEGVNGFSFNPYDEEQLFEIINSVTDWSYDLVKMGNISKTIIREHSPENVARIYIEAIVASLNKN